MQRPLPESSSSHATSPQDGPRVAEFLTLVADQLIAALGEANHTFGELAHEVLTLARHASDTIAPEAEAAACKALVGLQSIDRLQQRLGSVDRNLRSLATLLDATDSRPSERDWAVLLKAVRERYTTETERAEFDSAIVVPAGVGTTPT